MNKSTTCLISLLANGLIFFYTTLACYGQNQREIITNTDSVLLTGIYIQNLKMTVPWGMGFDSLYGGFNNKGLYKVHTKGVHYLLKLDSATIFSGIKVNLTFWGKSNCIFCKQYSQNDKLWELKATFNPNYFETLKDFFESHTQKPSKLYKGINNFYYIYYINNCYIRLENYQNLAENNFMIQCRSVFNN